jgi:hypothetical protein
MNKPTYKKILEHPDKEEIINKLIIGQPTSDIHDWLRSKYTNVNELKFVISEKILKSFQATYLDFYTDIQADMVKTKSAVVNNTSDQLELSVKGNSAYRDAMVKMANKELDIVSMLSTLAVNIETRMAQIYDSIQDDPNNINTKVDRLVIDYAETFGNLLDKIYKFTEVHPDLVVQHNISLQGMDPHISILQNVIKKVLMQVDLESSQYFMELLNEELAKTNLPVPGAPISQDMKMAEVKLLNETINKKINEP